MTIRPSQIQLTEILDLAVELAKEAGKTAMAQRHELDSSSAIATSGQTKSSSVDLVTAADKNAEQIIIEGILRARPDDGVLGEEGGARQSVSGVRWVIDPIDGTTNFVYGIPDYSVSIAVEHEGTTLVGVVYQPVTATLYSAVLGRGANKTVANNKSEPMAVNSPTDISLSLVATGFGYLAERRQGQAEVLCHLMPQIRDIRRFGSAALDLCYVAEGRVDAYYERGLNDWDMAAGALIASEAGAQIGNLRGNNADSDFLLAAAPLVFQPLRSLLLEAGADQRI